MRNCSENPEQFLLFSKPPSLPLPFPAPSSLKLEKFCTPATFFIYPPTWKISDSPERCTCITHCSLQRIHLANEMNGENFCSTVTMTTLKTNWTPNSAFRIQKKNFLTVLILERLRIAFTANVRFVFKFSRKNKYMCKIILAFGANPKRLNFA